MSRDPVVEHPQEKVYGVGYKQDQPTGQQVGNIRNRELLTGPIDRQDRQGSQAEDLQSTPIDTG